MNSMSLKYQKDKAKHKAMSLLGINPMTVLITPEAEAKQRALIDNIDAEIFWFGRVRKTEFKDREVFEVFDILVPEQRVSGASIDTQGADLVPFMAQHVDILHELLYNGHSHVNFDTFTSGVDYAQICGWEDYGVPHMISYIGNKQGKVLCRFDQFEPHHLTQKVKMVVSSTEEATSWAREQIRDVVEIAESVKVGKNSWRNQIVKPKGVDLEDMVTVKKEDRWVEDESWMGL